MKGWISLFSVENLSREGQTLKQESENKYTQGKHPGIKMSSTTQMYNCLFNASMRTGQDWTEIEKVEGKHEMRETEGWNENHTDD